MIRPAPTMKHLYLETRTFRLPGGRRGARRWGLWREVVVASALGALAGCVPEAALLPAQQDDDAGTTGRGGDGGALGCGTLGAREPCTTPAAAGACEGQRTCRSDGNWSACQAAGGTSCPAPDYTPPEECEQGTGTCPCVEGASMCVDGANESRCVEGAFGTPSPCPEDASCRGGRCRALEWTVQLGTAVGDNSNAVSVDEGGNIVIVGFSANGINADNQSFVRKYNALGGEPALWERQFGTPTDDTALAVTVDREGNVIVAGLVSGAFDGETSAGGNDAYIRKYDRGGLVLWTHQFGTPGNDAANAVRADAIGNVIAAGYVE
jgi:hypothetical protein